MEREKRKRERERERERVDYKEENVNFKRLVKNRPVNLVIIRTCI